MEKIFNSTIFNKKLVNCFNKLLNIKLNFKILLFINWNKSNIIKKSKIAILFFLIN